MFPLDPSLQGKPGSTYNPFSFAALSLQVFAALSLQVFAALFPKVLM